MKIPVGFVIVFVVSAGLGAAVWTMLDFRMGLELGLAQGAECSAVCAADEQAVGAVYDGVCECGATLADTERVHAERSKELAIDG